MNLHLIFFSHTIQLEYRVPSSQWLILYLSQSRNSAHNELVLELVCVHISDGASVCVRKKRTRTKQRERDCMSVYVCLRECVCVCGKLWKGTVHHWQWQARVEGVGAQIAASSAVMLTDTVPGGTVTQRDGLRHNCPINTSQQLPCMHRHTDTHTEKGRWEWEKELTF